MDRPEFVESTYLLYRATKDPYYLHVGKAIIESLQRCRYLLLSCPSVFSFANCAYINVYVFIISLHINANFNAQREVRFRVGVECGHVSVGGPDGLVLLVRNP